MNWIECAERILGFAILFQSLELLFLKRIWADNGIWRWQTLRQDFEFLPRPIRFLFDATLNQKYFLVLLSLRVLAGFLLLFGETNWILLLYTLLSSWLISIRWRGTLNGGSDSMTIVVSIGLLIIELFPKGKWGLLVGSAYIAVQLTASYFVAGIVKVRNKSWRTGQALPSFIQIPGYDSPPPLFKELLKNRSFAIIASYSVILAELIFPLAWIHPKYCATLLGLAFIFHLFNFWIFGLNRFVFAWLAAYPALYFWSQRFKL